MFSREFVDVTPLQFILLNAETELEIYSKLNVSDNLEYCSVSTKPLSAIIIKIKEGRV